MRICLHFPCYMSAKRHNPLGTTKLENFSQTNNTSAGHCSQKTEKPTNLHLPPAHTVSNIGIPHPSPLLSSPLLSFLFFPFLSFLYFTFRPRPTGHILSRLPPAPPHVQLRSQLFHTPHILLTHTAPPQRTKPAQSLILGRFRGKNGD